MQKSSVFTAPYLDEPLLMENDQRFVLFPIQYHSIYEMYKKHLASFWTADEIDLYQDLKDW
jgi:ribonucleotide reductase beta subunit family protein with ferritin-like domain